MKNKLLKGLVILTLTICLQACNTINSGRIERKNYSPGYTWVEMRTVTNGKQSTTIPIQHYVPESYSFTIRGKDEEGKEGTNTIHIPSMVYMEYEVGDWYPKSSRGGDFK